MDEELVGSIKLFAGSFIPEGYMECNGQLLPVQPNVVIYSILGTTYGGNGSVDFALPKLTPPHESMKYIINVRGIYPSRP
jgi:microcystin-dependent protein